MKENEMPSHYLKSYSQHFSDKTIAIACKEEILKENLSNIIDDICFINKQKIATLFFHNITSCNTNKKITHKIKHNLIHTKVFQIDPAVDFHDAVLQNKNLFFKLIFVEKNYLINKENKRINTFTTENFYQNKINCSHKIITKDTLIKICETIEASSCQRIHIVPCEKFSIRKELFSLEGSGTMVANNFTEKFYKINENQDAISVKKILNMHKYSGYLKERSLEYVLKNKKNFFVTSIDNIIVGCIERKFIDDNTIELAALAISSRFLHQRIGIYTIMSLIEYMKNKGYHVFIILTKNPNLQELLYKIGFIRNSSDRWAQRQKLSPEVPLFVLYYKN